MTDYEVLKNVKLQSPLADLIQSRMQELGFAPEDLGFRLNYRNRAKGAGRVAALCNGHINNRKSRAALLRLPVALKLPEETVQQAVAATQNLISDLHRQAAERTRLAREEADARWRADFRPHAVIDTVNKCPSQIVICAMTGGIGRWLIIRLDREQPPVTFVQQAVHAMQKLRSNSEGHKGVPFFGRALGFTINYTPDQAVRFNLEGEPLEVLPAAYKPGVIQLRLG